MSQIILILGGARSGKSSFAEKIAKKIEKKEVVYLATAQALDNEMKERIKHHKKQRPLEWKTVEEPIEIGKAIKGIKKGKTILMDCLTLYISNVILKNDNLEQRESIKKNIIDEIKKIIKIVRENDLNLIIVSNEVGQGVVPDNELGRFFRDITGWANQFTADKADRIFLTVAGFPVDLKEISIKNRSNFLDKLKED